MLMKVGQVDMRSIAMCTKGCQALRMDIVSSVKMSEGLEVKEDCGQSAAWHATFLTI